MSNINTKRTAIANRVLDLFQEFPDEESQKLFLDTFMALSGLGVRDSQQGSKTSKSKTDRSAGKAARSDPADTISKKSPPPVEAVATVLKDKGTINPMEDSSINFMKAVKDKASVARRQPGAMNPRMDHKSIKARVSACRKTTRRALKEYKEITSQPGVTPDAELPKIRNLVNAVKSFRLVFQDAFTARLNEVNVGVDLVENFVGPETYKALAEILENSSLVANAVTGFWEDPDGVLSTTLSGGAPSEVKENPFAFS